MKKALFIMGGPRKNGNLASMLNTAMGKAKDAGYKIHYVNLYEKKISPGYERIFKCFRNEI